MPSFSCTWTPRSTFPSSRSSRTCFPKQPENTPGRKISEAACCSASQGEMEAHQHDQHASKLRETGYDAEREISDDHPEYRHQGREGRRAAAAERDHSMREQIDG